VGCFHHATQDSTFFLTAFQDRYLFTSKGKTTVYLGPTINPISQRREQIMDFLFPLPIRRLICEYATERACWFHRSGTKHWTFLRDEGWVIGTVGEEEITWCNVETVSSSKYHCFQWSLPVPVRRTRPTVMEWNQERWIIFLLANSSNQLLVLRFLKQGKNFWSPTEYHIYGSSHSHFLYYHHTTIGNGGKLWLQIYGVLQKRYFYQIYETTSPFSLSYIETKMDGEELVPQPFVLLKKAKTSFVWRYEKQKVNIF
jgi:hypothetical protein